MQAYPDDALEVVGFQLSGETLRDLSAIDLVGAPGEYVPPEVLLIERDDAPPADELVADLEASGSRVERYSMSGYEDFMTDGEETSVLPEPTLQRIEDWLDRPPLDVGRSAKPVDALAPVLESASLTIADPNAGEWPPGRCVHAVSEETLRIDDRFFALKSTPVEATSTRRASVVLLTTGSVSRIGPGRLYVTLARLLAGLGFSVVRVDLGGVGDSIDVDPSTENQPMASARVAEIRDVVASVRAASGHEHVVAGGLCSAAFNSFHAAIDGLNVDNLLLVNPGTFYLGADELGGSDEAVLASAHQLTRGFLNRRRLMLALRDREAMRRGLKAMRYWLKAKPLTGYRILAGAKVRQAARRVGLPVKETSELARDLEAIVSGGVRMLIVIAAGESAAQYLRTFGGRLFNEPADGRGLEHVHVDGGDHTFASPGSRHLLTEIVTTYLEREYPSSVGRPAAVLAGRAGSVAGASEIASDSAS